jgi:hypothetical protein
MQIFPFTPFEIMPAFTNAGERQNKGGKTKAVQTESRRTCKGFGKQKIHNFTAYNGGE